MNQLYLPFPLNKWKIQSELSFALFCRHTRVKNRLYTLKMRRGANAKIFKGYVSVMNWLLIILRRVYTWKVGHQKKSCPTLCWHLFRPSRANNYIFLEPISFFGLLCFWDRLFSYIWNIGNVTPPYTPLIYAPENMLTRIQILHHNV